MDIKPSLNIVGKETHVCVGGPPSHQFYDQDTGLKQ